MANQNLPTAGKYVDDALVLLYGTTIDQLISDMGRYVIFYLPPISSGCPNCAMGFDGSSQGVLDDTNPFTGEPYNKPFPNLGICPVCRGTHKILTVQTATYKCLIQRDAKELDYTQYGKDIDPRNIYRLKCKVATFEDIKIAEKAKIDGEMCVPIAEPVKTGLRDIRYVKSYWIKTDA